MLIFLPLWFVIEDGGNDDSGYLPPNDLLNVQETMSHL